jgi:phospholipid/cholesterol/gamma-HCH transport system permease protein
MKTINKILSQVVIETGKATKAISKLPSKIESKYNIFEIFFINVSKFSIFTGRFFSEMFKPPFEFNEITRQSYLIGYKSLPLVGITGFIMGLVFTIQSRPTLAEFGAESWLPAMISISLVREIAPVITALICAGKVGSGIGAELASMKVTEQIDAMEVSGNNPFKYLIVTRVLSTMLMLPILTLFSDFISILGAFIGVNIKGDVSFHLFITQALANMKFTDVFPSIIKTVFFGLAIGLISSYKGYNSNKGTEGVGQAANSSVVLGSLMVFVIDIIAVQITSLFIK